MAGHYHARPQCTTRLKPNLGTNGELKSMNSAQAIPPKIGGASAYTVCFSGTACKRDEGEETRPESDRRIYCNDTGYIPVRIHKEISGILKAEDPSLFCSAIVRGPGENDWSQPRNDSEPL